jgi:hypothetical protein
MGVRESGFDDTMKDGELSLDHGEADIAINDICDYALYPQNIRALMNIIERAGRHRIISMIPFSAVLL